MLKNLVGGDWKGGFAWALFWPVQHSCRAFFAAGFASQNQGCQMARLKVEKARQGFRIFALEKFGEADQISGPSSVALRHSFRIFLSEKFRQRQIRQYCLGLFWALRRSLRAFISYFSFRKISPEANPK